MALTYHFIEEADLGNRKLWIGTVDFDSSYPTGGESLADIETGRHIVMAWCHGAYKTVFDNANQKLKAFSYPDAAGKAAEVADTTDLSGETDYNLVVLME